MEEPISEKQSEFNGSIYTMLVTANVGSLFEDVSTKFCEIQNLFNVVLNQPLRLLRPWLAAFLQKVGQIKPKFLALHLQEVGGKTYEKSMESVQDFIKQLCEAPEMQNYEVIRIFLDEDFNSAEHFTVIKKLGLHILNNQHVIRTRFYCLL